MHVGLYLQMVHTSEKALQEAFKTVADHHQQEPEGRRQRHLSPPSRRPQQRRSDVGPMTCISSLHRCR